MSILETKANKPIPVIREGYGIETDAIGNSVSQLKAFSHPDGKRIDLQWTNPVGATHVKILRRQQSFAFDTSDLGTLVYNGTVISSFSDTGLDTQRYYYYLVAVSTDSGVTYNVENSSRVFQLSISDSLKSKEFLWQHVPEVYKEEDAQNGNVLQQMVDVLGAGLNLIRSRAMVIPYLNEPDKSPLNMVLFQAESLGFTPELSFDFNTTRRAFSAILSNRKDKGDADGIVDFVSIFCEWDATVAEFGSGAGGSRVFQTWGGPLNQVFESFNTNITFGDGFITDPAATWTVDQWANGVVIDAVGNVIPVESNTATTLTLKGSTVRGTLSSGVSAGATTLNVTSTAGWRKGMSLQIRDGSHTECVTVEAVGTSTLTINRGLTYTYASTAELFRIPMLAMMEYLSSGVASGVTLQDTGAYWNTNQWAGYKVLDSANTKRTIVSNTVDTLTLSGGVVTGSYSIAYDFSGASFATRVVSPTFKVASGQHSFLYEPRKKKALRGTIDDPFYYLYAGTATILSPAFGLGDVAVFISGVAQEFGFSSGLTSTVLTSTDELIGYATDYFKGMWLNPNRNQTKLFKILSSDGVAGTVTVEGDMTGFAAAGGDFFILSNRDALRYSRLVERLQKEVPYSTRIYVFFE